MPHNITFHHHHPENTSETALAVHHGQSVEILRELGDDERDPEVGRMFRVRFADGFEEDVHGDELRGL
jgi:hypothetical protein